PTFDGEMKNLKDVESWLLGRNKFFILHDDSENMKSVITTFNLKGKANILVGICEQCQRNSRRGSNLE
ncbi:hypothetical protein, partial [Actinobacillus pleuropneumoniae]